MSKTQGTQTMTSDWVTDRPNILSPHALEQIKRAILSGPVFGRHHHYAGGSSADNWAFNTFELFLTYVSHSKPGDLFEIWSLPDLLAKGMALRIAFDTSSTAGPSPSLDDGLQEVKTYLDVHYNEFLALYSVNDSSNIEVQLDDIDGYETLLERVSRYSRGDGGIYVLPFTRIDTEDYMLLGAKYPDAEGKVPIGGPY